MEYKPLTFPIPDDITADLCDPGSPPEGHVRVALLRFAQDSTSGDYVAATGPEFMADIKFVFGLWEQDAEYPSSYRIGYTMPELLRMVQDWQP